MTRFQYSSLCCWITDYMSSLCFVCSCTGKMSYVIENLYLGDIDDAVKSFDLKQQKGVTHILTVDR